MRRIPMPASPNLYGCEPLTQAECLLQILGHEQASVDTGREIHRAGVYWPPLLRGLWISFCSAMG